MRDLLTREECNALWAEHDDLDDQLQAAARLGAERERERAARVCEAEQQHRLERAQRPFTGDDADVQAHKSVTAGKLAAAIRRGEGEQA